MILLTSDFRRGLDVSGVRKGRKVGRQAEITASVGSADVQIRKEKFSAIGG